MVRRRACAVSNHESARPRLRGHPSIRRFAAPQDEDFFLGACFLAFFADLFFAAGFLATGFLTTGFFAAAFDAFFAFGRLRNAARCAAASAALAHSASSSESSNRRAGNCQYEFTVMVLVLV